jgi:ubiquinone/menaquinone biosynthesis C-methylase UbiE
MFSDPSTNLSKLGIGEGMKVVDLGAGSGFYTIEAGKKAGTSGRVYSVEVQKNLVDRVKDLARAQGLNNIEVIWGDIEKIGGTKLRESIADRVIVSNVLFQIEKTDDMCLEIKRITKIGGKVLVIDWNDMSPLSPKTLFPQMKAEMLFEKHGFKYDSSFDAGDHHYGLIFIRS